MDQTTLAAGKRDANAANAEKPPPQKVQNFDLTKDDGTIKAAVDTEVPK